MSETIEHILFSEPNARIIIVGDINQLKIKDLLSQHNLQQLVKNPTRNHKILDEFLTNCPYLSFKVLVRSGNLNQLESWNWNQIHDCNDVNDTVTLFNDTIINLSNECFPLIKVKISRDPPYMSPP